MLPATDVAKFLRKPKSIVLTLSISKVEILKIDVGLKLLGFLIPPMEIEI